MAVRERLPDGEKLFRTLGGALLAVVLLIPTALLVGIAFKGIGRLGWSFVAGVPSRFPEDAGLLPALAGSMALLVLTGLLAVPLGVGAAIYLEEYGRGGSRLRARLLRVVELNIASLAAVPSIVFGLLGLAIFVRGVGLGPSLLAGGCALALLILPVIILAARESLRAVPDCVREAAAVLGATRWQTVRHHILPQAWPNMLAGVLRALSRVLGEAAPLVLVGVPAYVAFPPESLLSPFSALPIQIFNWLSRPHDGFQENAAAAILVLLILVFALNGTAILLRNRRRGGWHG